MEENIFKLLTTRIFLQKAILAPDDMGGRLTQWADFKALWSNMSLIRSNNLFGNRYGSNRVLYQFLIRMCKSVNPRMRIKVGKRIFYIRLIEPYKINPKLYHKLIAYERIANEFYR